MKLRTYLAACLAICTTALKAQKADTAQAIIHYKFTHVRNTLDRDKPLTENMMLLVGRNASWYRSYDRKQREEQVRKAAMAQLSSGATNLNLQGVSPAAFGPNIEYYQFPNENKFYSKERLFTTYLIEDKMPAIAWKISTDTMTIKGLACQKAMARFKGRDYTAWFCADLPYRVGPWKLGGLPGLIVEAYDAKREVMFQFDGVEKIDPKDSNKPADGPMNMGGRVVVIGGMGGDTNQNPNVITLPKNGVKVSAKELDDLKEIQRKDPEAFMQAQIAAMRAQSPSGANVSFRMNSGGATATSNGISSVNVQTSGGPAKTVVVNNPIELPEKGAKK